MADIVQTCTQRLGEIGLPALSPVCHLTSVSSSWLSSLYANNSLCKTRLLSLEGADPTHKTKASVFPHSLAPCAVAQGSNNCGGFGPCVTCDALPNSLLTHARSLVCECVCMCFLRTRFNEFVFKCACSGCSQRTSTIMLFSLVLRSSGSSSGSRGSEHTLIH